MSKELLEEIADLKKENKYAEKRISILLGGKTEGYKELFSRSPTVIPYIQEKDVQIKLLREALEKLEKYIAYNGDCWVQNVARQALAEIDKMKGV